MSGHFQGKTAGNHLSEKKEITSYLKETHVGELSGLQANFTDSLRETTIVLTLFFLISSFFSLSWSLFLIFASAYAIWRSARIAWIGWSRIEKLHRIIEEERYEIEHHPDQEREELETLYKHKGFEGSLLKEIVDHYMSDFDRLLRVMLEEEMGLTLSSLEHPLKQAFGGLLGAAFATVCLLIGLFLPTLYFYAIATLLFALSAVLSAYWQKNQIISALVWTLAIATLSLGSCYFLLKAIL